MTNNVVYLDKYKPKPKITANVVQTLLTVLVNNYNDTMAEYQIDVEDPDIAFDIATIQFLFRGMVHRSQGELHPSQKILNAMKEKMLP